MPLLCCADRLLFRPISSYLQLLDTHCVRVLTGGGAGVAAFKALSHEFLVVTGPGPDGFHYGDCTEYIVDPRFREQFHIPQVLFMVALILTREH